MSDAEGERLLAALADGSLPPVEFSHAQHLRSAFALLQRYPLDEASTRFEALLRHYVAGLGAEHKFHLTVSRALMRLAASQLRPGMDWASFQHEAAPLFADARGLLARHYSEAQLDAGRQQWREPDRVPLPGRIG